MLTVATILHNNVELLHKQNIRVIKSVIYLKWAYKNLERRLSKCVQININQGTNCFDEIDTQRK